MSGERLAGRELWGLALLTILWGFNWPVMKTGVSAIAPMTFRSLSMLLAVPMLWWMVRATGESIRIPRAHWREIALIALFNMAIWYVCVMYGVSLLSSGRAAILGYTMPIWAAVLGIVLGLWHASDPTANHAGVGHADHLVVGTAVAHRVRNARARHGDPEMAARGHRLASDLCRALQRLCDFRRGAVAVVQAGFEALTCSEWPLGTDDSGDRAVFRVDCTG